MKSTDRTRAGPQAGPRQAAEHASGNGGNGGDSPRQQQQGQRISQLRSAAAEPASASPPTPAADGLPDALRAGIESLSGMDMSGVRVHVNSSKPAALQAHAYAQGQDIHLGPGQERHLPHEAWHLVQQAQGRVRPTVQMHGGVAINDDHRLEEEADVMGARALQLKPKAVAASPRQAAQAQTLGQTRGETAQAVFTSHGVAQLDGKRRRNKARHKAQAQEARRSAAVDRRNQGMPSTHPDPVVAASLDKLDQLQPRKSAARKNIERREQRLANYRQAGRPSVVEAGAGEGRFSSAFAAKYGDNYAATDIASTAGPNGFLSIAKQQGLQSRFSVNANALGSHFSPGSLDHVVGANPFGVKGVGGASYGLKEENPGGTGKAKWRTDPRFLSSAKPLLKPGGSVEMYGRSNVIRDQKLSRLPMDKLRGEEARKMTARREKVKAKYPGENANPYMAVSPDELQALAKQTGYRVKVKRAKQPRNTVRGGNPDTRSGDSERRDTGLKPFNTHFSFTPQEQGYESDEDDPRVEYLSDPESDWED